MNKSVEERMHFKDYRSGELTNGIERSAHRALLYSTGLEEEDLHKLMVAVAGHLCPHRDRKDYRRKSGKCAAS